MSELSKISIVIPFRGRDSYRVSNLHAVASHLLASIPEAEIIIVEQDSDSKVDGLISVETVSHLLIEDEGPFNKSRLVNLGVGQAANHVILVSDADVLVPATSLEKSISALSTELEFVRPYQDLIDLDQQQSEQYISAGTLPDSPNEGENVNRSHLGERLCLAGGSFLIRKSLFNQIGGFDERFLGWGGEDDAFSLRVNSASKKVAVLKQSMAWHLWHPRVAAQENPHYRKNCQLLRETQVELGQNKSLN